MQKTVVVNIRSTQGLPYTYIGRGSPFGNPYVIGVDGTREEVCAAFRGYFDYRIVHDEAWRELVEGLKGKTLGCHCAPLQCHGQTYVDYLEG